MQKKDEQKTEIGLQCMWFISIRAYVLLHRCRTKTPAKKSNKKNQNTKKLIYRSKYIQIMS